MIETGGGFVSTLDNITLEPVFYFDDNPYTSAWDIGYGYITHASMANACFNRYSQLKTVKPAYAEQYKRFVIAAAEQYMTSVPAENQVLKPGAFAGIIGLLINASRLTGSDKYLQRAGFFAGKGIEIFLNADSPLPKASNTCEHYESLTGGPSFMLSLLNLHAILQANPKLIDGIN
jgi:hypothetical protein